MMVHRTGGDRGNLEIDLRVRGFGRFRCSAQTQRTTVLRKRVALARLLGELGQFDVLAGLKSGRLAWATVELAQRQQRLQDGSLGADLQLARSLQLAINETLPRMGTAATTRERYALALAHLATLGVLTPAATVADLRRDDWLVRLAAWDAAVATKNGVRRAVSRFLTRYLGDKFHPFRRAVLHEDRWPRLKEPRRLRGFAAEHFWALMSRVPEHLVPSYVLLAATGMRVGEYLNDAAIQLDEINRTIMVDGKTGPKLYAIAPAVWPYVRSAVPCRVANMRQAAARLQDDARYKKLYRRLREAGKALGITATVHDLRRLFVRLGVAAKGETATQTAVGHETPAMTREYARWHTQQDVAEAVAMALGLGVAPPMSGKKSGNSKRNHAARGGT